MKYGHHFVYISDHVATWWRQCFSAKCSGDTVFGAKIQMLIE